MINELKDVKRLNNCRAVRSPRINAELILCESDNLFNILTPVK